MGSLIGLPGVAGGRIDDVSFFRTVSHAMKLLVTDRAATAAGDHGAVTVYRDDTGKWHCAFHRHWMEVEHTVVERKTDIRSWLLQWLPQIA